MGVDHFAFQLAQSEESSVTSSRICSDSILLVGWGKRKGQKSINSRNFWIVYDQVLKEILKKHNYKQKISNSRSFFKLFFKNFTTWGCIFPVLISNTFGAGQYYLVVRNLEQIVMFDSQGEHLSSGCLFRVINTYLARQKTDLLEQGQVEASTEA